MGFKLSISCSKSNILQTICWLKGFVYIYLTNLCLLDEQNSQFKNQHNLFADSFKSWTDKFTFPFTAFTVYIFRFSNGQFRRIQHFNKSTGSNLNHSIDVLCTINFVRFSIQRETRCINDYFYVSITSITLYYNEGGF